MLWKFVKVDELKTYKGFNLVMARRFLSTKSRRNHFGGSVRQNDVVISTPSRASNK